jgi:hypothetical protein
MKTRTTSVLLNPWLALAIAAALTLGGANAARAAENHTGAWGLISTMGSQNPYDALWLVMGDPANPIFHNNLIYVNMDMQYNYQSYGQWESATWRPASSFPTQRFAASLLGTDWATDPMEGRYIQLRNLTLDRADLDAQNVEFRFSPIPPVPGATTSLTLNNGSLTSNNIPLFNANALFTLTASGNSLIHGWTGRIGSQTTLNITPGAKLTLDWCGDMSATLVTSSMYFGRMDNAATIDGGTLRLQQSYVTFGSSAFDPAHPSKMTFKNNAKLEVTGDRSKLVADEFDFINSSLMLANNNTLRVRGTLTLDTASVVIGSDAEVHVPALVVKGLSTMALGDPGDPRFQPVQAGAMQMQPDAILTLTGQGGLQTEFLGFVTPSGVQQYGRIIVNDDAELITGTDGLFMLRHGAVVTINRTDADVYGLMIARKGGSIEYGLSNQVTNHLTNHGQISAEDGSALNFYGDSTILGGSEGRVDIGSGGVLGAGLGAVQPAINRLTTGNTVVLDNFSTLQLTLDPTNLTNDQVRVGSTLWIEQWAGLNLSVINDKVLLAGMKFILVDYHDWQGGYAQKTFNGYPDGSTLVLGLNTYQIKYAGTGDAGYTAAITLTVVDPVPPTASLSPAAQTLSGTVGVALTPSVPLVPTNFGGTVTYSINPILPAGLSLAIATGVISGVPTEILASTPFTIRGVGSTSGSATVTVTLALAIGSQTITFNPTPPPTYAPGGGFLVSASASSGLPVKFTSTTLAICTVVDDTVFMLSAGTCTIVASQGGNTNYNPAPPVTQNISVAKALPVLILSATPGIIHVGETSVLSTKSGSTGAISYAVSGPCTLVGVNTLKGNDTGTCSVTAMQVADGNYNAGQSSPVAITVRAITAVPSLSEWGMLIMALLMVLAVGRQSRRRKGL